MGSILTIMSTTSSCQPHQHVIVGKRNRSECASSGLKRLSGAKACVFSGKVASVVAEVGSLFPQFRASICKSCRQNVRRTVARARFIIKNVKTEAFGGLLEDEVGQMCTSSISHKCARARFHIKIVKKPTCSEHFWKMRSANFVDSLID